MVAARTSRAGMAATEDTAGMAAAIRRQAAGGKVRDPVCGMEVDPHTAVSVMHQGRTFYFCSAACRERFAKAPDDYMGSSIPGGHHHG